MSPKLERILYVYDMKPLVHNTFFPQENVREYANVTMFDSFNNSSTIEIRFFGNISFRDDIILIILRCYRNISFSHVNE